MMLVHGGAAHARWWDSVGPLLLDERIARVVAIDLSGHGDSGHRATYSVSGWADELNGIAEQQRDAKPTIVGHSMGGMVALKAVQRRPDLWSGLIIVDSPIGRAPWDLGSDTVVRSHSRHPGYANPEEAASRFRLVPPQPTPKDLSDIAVKSLRQATDGRWYWKFDPRAFQRPDRIEILTWGDVARATRGRIAFIYGEKSSVVDGGVLADAAAAIGADNLHVVHDAHHHLILDSAPQCADLVRGIVAKWAVQP